jgi:hypothetical protein
MPVGLNVGGGIRPGEGTSLLLGGEVSIVDMRRHRTVEWPVLGAYVDVLYDGADETWRGSIGPEFLLYPGIGIDAGFVAESPGEHYEHARAGARLRYFAPALPIIPYFGTTMMFSGEDRVILEFGTLLKVPLLLGD